MELTKRYVGHSGAPYSFGYVDADSFDDLDVQKCKQTYAVCFCGDNIVIVLNGKKNSWGLVGGTIEKKETLEQALRREIQEESNMEVIAFLPVGYQKVVDTRDQSFFYQLRYVCTARPYGPFTIDPAGSVIEMKLIPPEDYRKYFDWGEIGERIIERALELRPQLG